MGLTSDSLSARLSALELEVGTGKLWPESASTNFSEETSLVTDLSILQAKVDRLFLENAEFRCLPDIIKKYRKDPIPEGSRESTSATSDVHISKDNAEKQELISIKYPDILECYNLLLEFQALDIPAFSSDLSDKLTLKPILERQWECQNITQKFQIIVVKSVILLEEFTDMIRHQTAWSQCIDRRVQALSQKLVSLERKQKADFKY